MAAPMPKSVSFLEKREIAKEAYEYPSKSAYLSPLGRPYIYSRCSTSWIVTRIRFYWMRFPCYQYRIWWWIWEEQFIWDNLPSLLGGIQLAMICHYFSFLNDEIWLDG